eukprot:s6925_g1.t1
MGGKRKRGRSGKGKGGKGKGKGGKNKDDPEEDSEDEADVEAKKARKSEDAWRDTEPWEYKNDNFEAYYRRQQICSEEDFVQLMETLRTGLPAAIRVNRLRLGAASLRQRLSELVESCRDDPERAVYAPKQLTWYGHGLGWVWPGLERRTIKKDSRHASLKEYLSQRERAGLISRQEVLTTDACALGCRVAIQMGRPLRHRAGASMAPRRSFQGRGLRCTSRQQGRRL